MPELFAAGPVYLRVAAPKHEWSSARKEWMDKKHEDAAFSIMESLRGWRSQPRTLAGGPALRRFRMPGGRTVARSGDWVRR